MGVRGPVRGISFLGRAKKLAQKINRITNTDVAYRVRVLALPVTAASPVPL